jgi:hypothetical protein
VPILPSHRGRGQHGCGDQPSRQNFKSRHFSFSVGYRSQVILASALEMSGPIGGLNEKIVHGRSPLRETRGGHDHKFRRARRTPLRVNAPSAVNISFHGPKRALQRFAKRRRMYGYSRYWIRLASSDPSIIGPTSIFRRCLPIRSEFSVLKSNLMAVWCIVAIFLVSARVQLDDPISIAAGIQPAAASSQCEPPAK